MRAVLCGYYGFGNCGDEALLSTLLQMLPAHVQPVVLAANPRQMQKRYAVECRDRWNLFAVSSTIARADAFIWGGGSLMQDVTGRKSVLYYGSLMQLAQSFGKRTVAWAQGIGPLRDPWCRDYTRRLLAGCRAVSVRDAASARLLDSWSIPHEQTCDPVWALEPASNPTAGALAPPRVAVVLRPHPDLDVRRQAVIIAALDQLQRDIGASVLCVPFQIPGDEPLARTVAESLEKPGLVVSEGDPRRLMGLFASVQLTVAMRLHGVLMAAAGGNPVWGLSYDPKVTQLLSEIQAPGCELNRLPDDPAVLARAWGEAYRQGSGLNAEARQSWVQRARANARVLTRVLAPA
ncbi:polysaccharide pyruvyl transferase CsaB [Gloeobacter violaceus]|uniref:Glr0745 protein n=1 Tax=Gloeobacter violaceus (strain ATCC 29082 / PCC 7421) TaxID=251221 RepID=Q7NMM0_GLOVI|nr:polysaccharide pyruvyl transferase CsaB [Gloeobacter violaceus]BAC88686.1 glr0745 [Gloeobacter violaceus PCC 7421]